MIPYIYVSDVYKHKLLSIVNKDLPIKLAFRRWELQEYPTLPETKQLTWTIKTVAQTEKPRYIIVGFQVNRRNNISKIASYFDLCDLQNIKLYLNSEYYPYDNLNGCKETLYEMYSKFQSSYYDGSEDEPVLDRSDYMLYTPIVVIDCSYQSDLLKTGSVDVRLEIESVKNFPSKTTAYCLLISDNLLAYSPLSGVVRRSIE